MSAPPNAAAGNPTPPSEDAPNNACALYVPHDLKYSASFEDALVEAVLKAGSEGGHQGIRVIPEDSTEAPVDGVSVRAEDVSFQSLPVISEHELPLPLDDARRVFASPIPGLKLTHPGGYLEGGPGLDPEMDTFPDDFLSNNSNVRSGEELRAAKQRDVDRSIEQLKERLRARQKAKEKNEQIEKELKTLKEQHELELRVQRKMEEERRVKKEAKEKKMKQKDGG